MSKTLFNVTMLLVQEETEDVLAEQPSAVREAFVRNDLYQDLLAYVLSRVPNVYRAIDKGEETSIKSQLITDSARRKLDRETVICQGVYFCLEKRANLMKREERLTTTR